MRVTPSSGSLNAIERCWRLPAAAVMLTLSLHALSACSSERKQRHEQEAQYGLDITKPLSKHLDAVQELKDLDGFVRSAAVTPQLLYLPIHIRVLLTPEQMERYGALMRPDDCYDGAGIQRASQGQRYSNCSPTFLSGDALIELHAGETGGIAAGDDAVDISRALANFV